MADELPGVSTDREPAEDTQKLKDVHEEAIKRADEAYVMERNNIDEGREDQRFYAGGLGQWDAQAQKHRGQDRPMLTVNRLPAFLHQMTGEVRKNTPAIKVLPAKGEVSEDKAEVFNGLIRNIEAESDADACYAIALENAGVAGQGAFTIATEYEDEETFDQVIRIRPVKDPFGVLIDPMVTLPDKSDMRYGFVFERITTDVFKAEFPGKTADDMPMGIASASGGLGLDWKTDDTIRLALYWRKTKANKRKMYMLEDGSIVPALPKGMKAKLTREVEDTVVESYLMSGKEILSGPHVWAGKHIPICFVPGEEIVIDGSTKRKGIVRDAKDPQKLLNYARTTDAETTALQPKAPFVGTVNQFRGYEDIWATAGSQNHPYLPYNPDPQAPGAPQRSQPPVGSTALANLSLQAGQDMKDVIGLHDASLGARSNETSGVAIRARQREGDTGTFLYPDNLRRAIAYCGRVLCDLIPKIYDAPRVVRILKEDGSHDMASINQNAMGPDGQEMVDPETNLALGKYDVQVSTGKSYATRQEEMADDIVQLSSNMPVVGQVAPDLVVKALNFPGGDEIAERLKRTVPPNILEDQQGPAPPSPEAMAEMREKMASANLKDAQSAKTLLEADALATQLAAMPAQLQQLTEIVKSLVSGGAPQGPPEVPQSPPGVMPGGPPPGGPPQGAMPPGGPAMPNGESDMAELEPIEGAPV